MVDIIIISIEFNREISESENQYILMTILVNDNYHKETNLYTN